MGKIFLFFILIVGAVGYWVQDHDLINEIQISNEEAKEKGMFSVKDEPTPLPYNFRIGNCVSLDQGNWDHYIIRDLREEHYIVSECRKFKGCKANTKSFHYKDFDADYKVSWITKCAEKS
ncbi:MAG: hypothetical protein HN509_16960 [Halobacteriovoraceae bacterium]|jgi:hypothetical protein|nr:hypothetical protein [Halobacteriovoraceae bacterium]MBT5096079.1 hypothetical protein [Halobacteriovoraceae bacterium]